MGLEYGAAKKIVLKTIIILGIVTMVEVFIALLGKGYLISGFTMPHMLMGGLMIGLSMYKAITIIYEFMHMKYEMPDLPKTVLLPTLLLVWGIIAFLWEGNYWHNSRAHLKEKNELEAATPQISHSSDTKIIQGHDGH